MKQDYFTRKTFCFVVLFMVGILLLAPSGVHAQMYLNENFNYPEGDLYGQGGWMKYASSSGGAIQVVNNPLTYTGYQDDANGNAVELLNVASGQDLQKKFTEGDEHINSGTLYYSALINVKAAGDADDKVYFMAIVSKTATGNVADGKSGTEYARLFALAGEEGKFKLGVSRSSAKPVMSEEEYELNKTYLVVVKYECVDGVTNDEVSLFVNPVNFATEPVAAVAKYVDGLDGDVSAKNGFQAIECRQGGTTSKVAPNVIIDAIRVARSYPELFSSEAPEPIPAITLSKKNLAIGEVFIGKVYTQEINVKGVNLKSDITLSGMETGEITTSVTTISKADAEAPEGFNVTVTLTPKDIDLYTDNILFDSEGAAQGTLSVFWNSIELIDVADLKTLSTKKKEDYKTYRYTGEGVISYIYKDGTKTTYYVQDATGAIPVYDGFGDITVSYSIGDKITGFICTVESIAGLNSAIPADGTLGTVISKGNVVEPVVVTAAALTASPADYAGKLIKMENVTFKDVEEGAVFTEDLVSPAINDGTADARMKLFKGTDIMGTVIPTETVTLIGISTSAAAAVIAPRALTDIVKLPVGDPSLEITPEKVESKTAHLNIPTEFVTFTIKANNLPDKVSLYITGKSGTMFTINKEEIPAGTSETELVVTYTPTQIGKHEGRLNLECMGAPEFNKGIALSGVCIDPANPPVVTINPETLPAFSVEANKTQEQTIQVTTANLPDYLYAKMMNEGEGSFRINSSMFLQNGTYDLKITFAPKKVGTYTERIEFSTLELETFYLTITGTATAGEDPGEEKEGDELPLDTSNPTTLLNESFSSAVNNKPLSVTGWKNVATVGKRAWWGDDFKDGETVLNKVAKVTAYDSQVESGKETPCEMLLVTPPLDFKNAASKTFTFRVMGNLLRDDQTDLLELCYIDMEGDEMYISPVGGFEMPHLKDMNEEWLEYHIELEGQDIADIFFMGFRFKSTRGTQNSATYYIDDVSFGRTDLPKLTPSETQLAFEALVGTDYTTAPITVTGQNITEPITISLGGPNKSKFSVSEKTLPAEGGSFTLKFASNEIGVHEAYIRLSSKGAADVYIPISANAKDEVGIALIPFNETPDITVFDILGKVMVQKEKCTNMDEITNVLTSGTYVLRASSESGIRTIKIVVP